MSDRPVVRIAPNNPVFDLPVIVGIEEKLFEKTKAREQAWMDAVMSTLKGLPNVLDIRTIGLVAAIDLPEPTGPFRWLL